MIDDTYVRYARRQYRNTSEYVVFQSSLAADSLAVTNSYKLLKHPIRAGFPLGLPSGVKTNLQVQCFLEYFAM